MHLAVPRELLTEFNVQASYFSQAAKPISLILGSDVWRYISPIEIRRTPEYLLYKSVLSNKLLLAGTRRTRPEPERVQFTILALNNLKTSSHDIFDKEDEYSVHIAKLQYTIAAATAPHSLVTNKDYLLERESINQGCVESTRRYVPLHQFAVHEGGRSRSPWPERRPSTGSQWRYR